MSKYHIHAEAFQRWLVDNGKSEKSAKNYASTVNGPLSQWAAEADIIEESLFDLENHQSIRELAKRIQSLDIFIERNLKGKGMYRSALNWFGDFVSNALNSDVITDINDIYSQENTDGTQRESLVATRLGQGKFRDSLISHWGQCAATGYKQHSLLIASHIKPWRDSTDQERLDKFNGFLFVPNIDRTFDKKLISFKSSGEIIISPELEEPSRLGIDKTIKIDLSSQHQEYLEYHRDVLFRT